MLVTVFMIFGQTALIRHVAIAKLSPIRAFTKARVLDCLGFAAGMAAGYFAAFYFPDTTDSAKLCLAIAVVIVFVSSFNNRPLFPENSIIKPESQAPMKGKGLWSKRCRAVADEYGLSERQYEVLALIAQGRNAKFIEETLTISLSTAQTHIRNIYRKLNVHSRQELLDLIENTKLYGED